MAKKCMKCGGAMKMAKGGTVSKPFAAGIPYGTGAGATDGKNGMMRKGGAVKKMQDGGGILTPNGRLKSKKTRNLELSYSGSTGSTSRTKRNGDTVTKTAQTTNGYAGPSARKVKTVVDKAGNTVSEKEKNISVKAADRKIKRVINNVGRNANDTYSYKKGGAVKNAKLAALAAPKNKITRADVIVGAKRNARKK
jgi:hypothetical protein